LLLCFANFGLVFMGIVNSLEQVRKSSLLQRFVINGSLIYNLTCVCVCKCVRMNADEFALEYLIEIMNNRLYCVV